jgi:hypothetical protein
MGADLFWADATETIVKQVKADNAAIKTRMGFLKLGIHSPSRIKPFVNGMVPGVSAACAKAWQRAVPSSGSFAT